MPSCWSTGTRAAARGSRVSLVKDTLFSSLEAGAKVGGKGDKLFTAMAGMGLLMRLLNCLLLSAPCRPKLGRRPPSREVLELLPIRIAIEENEAVEPFGWCPRMKVGFVGERGKLSLAIAMPSFSGSLETPLALLACPAFMKSCLVFRFLIWQYSNISRTHAPPIEPRIAPRTWLVLRPDVELEFSDEEEAETAPVVESGSAVPVAVALAEVVIVVDDEEDGTTDACRVFWSLLEASSCVALTQLFAL